MSNNKVEFHSASLGSCEIPNKIKGVLKVDNDTAEKMERLCIKPDGNISHKENPFDEEYVFPDGCRMAIQVCSCHDTAKDPCWTQGVLFTEDGFEVGCTDVGDSFLGEYIVYYNHNEYQVMVEPEDPDGFMDIGKALEIVHAMAKRSLENNFTADIASIPINMGIVGKIDKTFFATALDVVEDFIVNHFGED